MEEEQPKRKPGRPATGRKPLRTIRAGAIWDEAAALAEQNGETMTDMVLRLLDREVTRLRRKNSKES